MIAANLSFPRSKLGLVALLVGTSEICIINESSLRVTRRFRAPGAERLTCSPKLSTAFVTDGHRASRLALIDLRRGKVRRTLSASAEFPRRIRGRPQGVKYSEFMYPKVAPDGKFLYVSCTECLVKMRASKLQTLEVSQRIGQGQRATLVSPDSQHVILMSGGGNSPIKGFPKIKYASYIYKISNLQIPVLAIKHGPYPAALGWDLVKKRIYAQRRGRQLMVFSEKGEKQAEFELGKQDMVLQLLVHPSGGKVCIWTEHNLYWIELAGL